ncbi:MAG: hypothetical protein GY793_00090 [Proteobacteria bacterium]|nr:hypothetical protein [Pseudomonadota bacterium]
MSALRIFVITLTFLSFLGGVNIVVGDNNAIAKTTEAKTETKKESDKLTSLPPEIQKRIKSRKRAIIKTRAEIRSLSPENKAELQENIEEWFKNLPLEKQVEIKIRMGGGIPSMEKIRMHRERNLSEKTKPVVEEKKEEVNVPEIKAEVKKEEKKVEAKPTPAPEEKEVKKKKEVKPTPAPKAKEVEKKTEVKAETKKDAE